MNKITIFYAAIAAGCLILLAGLANSVWSGINLSRLEKKLEVEKVRSLELEQRADAAEVKATEYKQKTIYIESELAAISAVANKQDEQIKQLNTITNTSRSAVDRARDLGSIESNAVELCERLAALGHACR